LDGPLAGRSRSADEALRERKSRSTKEARTMEGNEREYLIGRGWRQYPGQRSVFEPGERCEWLSPRGVWVRGTTTAIAEATRKAPEWTRTMEGR